MGYLHVEELLPTENVLVHAVHDVKHLRGRSLRPDVHVVVSGHSNQPQLTECDGVVYDNPGSASPRRFRLPVAVGELIVRGDEVSARVVELAAAPLHC